MPLSNRYAAMSEYARSPVVRDRLYGGLMAWSAGQLAQPIPANPDDEWIRRRLMAERIPQTPDHFTQRLAPYTLQTADIIDHIADHLAPFLETERADAVETQTNAAIQAAMPHLAQSEIPIQQVEQWRIDHNFPANGNK
jgi:hypothetical protein